MKRLWLLLIPLAVLAQTPTYTVTLAWTAPTTNADGSPLTDLAGYRVYWGVMPGDHPNSVDVGLTTTHVMTEQVLLSDTRYYFAVTAVDDSGLESDKSNEASAVTPDVTAPGPPSNVTVVITFP